MNYSKAFNKRLVKFGAITQALREGNKKVLRGVLPQVRDLISLLEKFLSDTGVPRYSRWLAWRVIELFDLELGNLRQQCPSLAIKIDRARTKVILSGAEINKLLNGWRPKSVVVE